MPELINSWSSGIVASMKFAAVARLDLGIRQFSPPARRAVPPARVVPRNVRRVTVCLFLRELAEMSLGFIPGFSRNTATQASPDYRLTQQAFRLCRCARRYPETRQPTYGDRRGQAECGRFLVGLLQCRYPRWLALDR